MLSKFYGDDYFNEVLVIQSIHLYVVVSGGVWHTMPEWHSGDLLNALITPAIRDVLKTSLREIAYHAAGPNDASKLHCQAFADNANLLSVANQSRFQMLHATFGHGAILGIGVAPTGHFIQDFADSAKLNAHS